MIDSAEPPAMEQADGSELMRVRVAGRWRWLSVAAVQACIPALVREAVATAVAPLIARVAALEARPEEAAHFTASAKMPALTIGQTISLTLMGLAPAVGGDVLRKGETVLALPRTGLPSGANIAAAYVPSDGAVVVQITTGVALAAGASPVAWDVIALR